MNVIVIKIWIWIGNIYSILWEFDAFMVYGRNYSHGMDSRMTQENVIGEIKVQNFIYHVLYYWPNSN